MTSKRQLLNQVLKEWDTAGQGQGEREWAPAACPLAEVQRRRWQSCRDAGVERN